VVACCCLAVQYKDLLPDTWLCLAVYSTQEGAPPALLGSTSVPMFCKKGRLKTGGQQLRVWEGVDLDLAAPHQVGGWGGWGGGGGWVGGWGGWVVGW
jgi:hypothetical protein